MNRQEKDANRYYSLYLKWLVDKYISPDENSRLPDPRDYQELFWKLFNTPFEYCDFGRVSHDKNRVGDAMYMRSQYEGKKRVKIHMPCSVLEVLIALAIRIETDVMQDICHPDRTATWFWLMLDNLGLVSDEFKDINYSDEKANGILTRFMHRTYEKDGSNGGLFQLNERGIDMRKTEIWYQMELYFARYRDDFE